MSQSETENQAQENTVETDETSTATATAIAPVVWYARPWVWSIVVFLLLLLLFAWIFWKQWQAYLALQNAQDLQFQKQLEYNTKLENEAQRLRDALAKEPCDVKLFLDQEGTTLLLQGAKIPDQEQMPPNKNTDLAAPATKAEAPPPPVINKNETAPTKTAPPNPVSSLAQSLEQATVLIIGDTGKALKTGTGFFIAPGIILTNAHVTQGSNKNIYAVGKFSELVSKAKLIAVSSEKGRDYAVLQVSITNVEPLKFSTNIARTQKISAWGFPGAVTDVDPNFKALLEGTAKSPPEVVYSEGTVSVVQEQNPPIIFHSAVVSHGNSGGPLVNENGDVVGINTYIALDDKSYRQSSLAIVSRDIVSFLKEKNIPFTLSTKE